MRRIKVILAAVTAMTTMTVLAAPAMAATNELTQTVGDVSNTISSDNDGAAIGGVLILGGGASDVDIDGIQLDNVGDGGITLVGSNGTGGTGEVSFG